MKQAGNRQFLFVHLFTAARAGATDALGLASPGGGPVTRAFHASGAGCPADAGGV